MRKFSKMLAFALAAAMVFTAFAPAAKADAAEKGMEINKQGKILYVTDGTGINDAAQVGGGKGNVSEYDFAVSNKPEGWQDKFTFEWSSSDEKIITVGKAGLTTAKGVGTADVECLVRDKATKTPLFTLTNTITVKANADKIEISAVKYNGSTYTLDEAEGLKVKVNDVVDLDRAMYDVAGNKTLKRGQFVTDYTKWFVTDAEGNDASDVVNVTQSNGKFEFTAAAAAGTYKLYCGTYQSKTYKDIIKTSEPLLVELDKDSTFTVTQKTPDSFVLTFDTKLAAAPEVKVTNVITDDFKIPMSTKDVKLESNGTDVTVTMFNDLADGFKYLIEAPGCKSYNLTASAGVPVSMEVFVVGKDVPTAVVESDTQIGYKLYDKERVDVTDLYKDKGSISFDAEYSSDYQLSYGGSLYFYEANKYAEVVVEFCLDGQDANGNDYAPLPKRIIKVLSVPKATTSLGKLTDVKINGKDAKVVTMIAGADEPADYTNTKLSFKITELSSDNAKLNPITFNGKVGSAVGSYGNLYVQVADNNILDVDENLNIIPYSKGSTNILFKVGKDADSARIIDYITVTVREPATFSYVKPAKNDVEVAVSGLVTTTTLDYSAFTQYNGEAYTFTTEEINKAKFAAKSDKDMYVDGLFSTDGKKITVNGSLMAVPAESETASVRYTYTFTIAGKSFDFRVTFKDALQDTKKDRYELVLTDGAFGEISRSKTADTNDKAEAEKFVEFTAYVINNSVKKATVPSLAKYVSGKATTEGAYYVNVLKDGKPVTGEAYVDVFGDTVTIKFNDVDDNDNVSYPAGTGSFVVELYEGTADGKGTRVYKSTASSTTKTDKAYKLVKQVETSVGSADDVEALMACFEFLNTEDKPLQGTDKVTADKVVATTITSGNSVRVVSFTFYDQVEAGVYVPYTVNIGKTLVIE